jgi:replicative superfamily II helicase
VRGLKRQFGLIKDDSDYVLRNELELRVSPKAKESLLQNLSLKKKKKKKERDLGAAR